MKRLLIFLIPALAAACTPALSTGTAPSCSASAALTSLGVAHLHVESDVAPGTRVTLTLDGNGARLGQVTTDVGYTGAVDLDLPVPDYGYPVHWVGSVLLDGAPLCSTALDT